MWPKALPILSGAALLVGFWIVFPPDGLEPRTGAFIALGAALLATFAPRPEPAA